MLYSFNTATRVKAPLMSNYLTEVSKLAIAQAAKVAKAPLASLVTPQVFNAQLEGTIKSKTQLHIDPGTYLQNIQCPRKSLRNSDLSGSTIAESNFWGSSFLKANLANTKLCLVDMYAVTADKLQAKASEMILVDFSKASLKEANFTHSTLSFVCFIGADLTKADFSNCQAKKGVIFIGAATSNIALPPGALSSPADLETAIKKGDYNQEELTLLHTHFSQAEKDMQATLPAHLTSNHQDDVSAAKAITSKALSDLAARGKIQPN